MHSNPHHPATLPSQRSQYRPPFVLRHLFNVDRWTFYRIKGRKACCASPERILQSTRTKYVSCSAPGTLIADFTVDGADFISFQPVTIGSLPDNVLLDIFDFALKFVLTPYTGQGWRELVRICRRWRYIVFASPRRLRLRFECRASTPMREILDFLPPMPIDIRLIRETDYIGDNVNVIAALEHPDRVCMIHLYSLPSSLLERFTTVMQEPFPVLTDLRLDCPHDPTPPVLPDTFLGGFAPRLETLRLAGIPFPALPKLLLSARDLTSLNLSNIPHSGYFSPEAMVTALSGLTNLKYLTLEFQSPSSFTNWGSHRPPPLTRVDLPALARLFFQGVTEYLEDFLVRMNTPVITTTKITFFDRVIFNIPQLFKFVNRRGARVSQASGTVLG